ncbi:hypothetical protein LIA77_04514 [Sarocladium implicatum]|nr:hypothetical protein LIA77_04514 [Sarocladium implicatum]
MTGEVMSDELVTCCASDIAIGGRWGCDWLCGYKSWRRCKAPLRRAIAISLVRGDDQSSVETQEAHCLPITTRDDLPHHLSQSHKVATRFTCQVGWMEGGLALATRQASAAARAIHGQSSIHGVLGRDRDQDQERMPMWS